MSVPISHSLRFTLTHILSLSLAGEHALIPSHPIHASRPPTRSTSPPAFHCYRIPCYQSPATLSHLSPTFWAVLRCRRTRRHINTARPSPSTLHRRRPSHSAPIAHSTHSHPGLALLCTNYIIYLTHTHASAFAGEAYIQAGHAGRHYAGARCSHSRPFAVGARADAYRGDGHSQRRRNNEAREEFSRARKRALGGAQEVRYRPPSVGEQPYRRRRRLPHSLRFRLTSSFTALPVPFIPNSPGSL